MRIPSEEAEAEPKPVTCPFCGSSKITTTSEHADTSSYWRCEGCGEMWNVGRLRASPGRFVDNRRWR